jgi:hypothetical protein
VVDDISHDGLRTLLREEAVSIPSREDLSWQWPKDEARGSAAVVPARTWVILLGGLPPSGVDRVRV